MSKLPSLTPNKIIKILEQFEITTFAKFIEEYKVMEGYGR